MHGYIVIKDKTFYNFKKKMFVKKWNKDCITQNREYIQEFIDKEGITITTAPLWIKGYGFIEDVIDLKEKQ